MIRRLGVVPLVCLSLLIAGCGGTDSEEPAGARSDTGGTASTQDEVEAEDVTTAEDSTAAQDGTDTSVVAGLPQISSCDAVAAIVAPYIAGIPFDEENSYVQPDAISCSWTPPEGSVDDLAQIQSFAVDLSEGDAEVPDPDEAAAYGFSSDMYFTDPRLDAIGGVGLWIDAGSAVVGGGVGTVMVPGVEVDIMDSRWGQESPLTRDELVTLSLALLDL